MVGPSDGIVDCFDPLAHAVNANTQASGAALIQ